MADVSLAHFSYTQDKTTPQYNGIKYKTLHSQSVRWPLFGRNTKTILFNFCKSYANSPLKGRYNFRHFQSESGNFLIRPKVRLGFTTVGESNHNCFLHRPPLTLKVASLAVSIPIRANQRTVLRLMRSQLRPMRSARPLAENFV